MILAERIIEDIKEREAFGLKKHGKGLDYADDPRDWLQEAYEEQLDAIFYLRAAICRRDKYTRWNRSDKRKLAESRYTHTPQGKASDAKYRKSEKRRAVMKQYNNKPNVKEKKAWHLRSSRKRQRIDSAIL